MASFALRSATARFRQNCTFLVRFGLQLECPLHQMMTQQTPYEVVILFASGNQFGDSQVMNFQTQTRAPASVLITNRNETFAPARRQNRHFPG